MKALALFAALALASCDSGPDLTSMPAGSADAGVQAIPQALGGVTVKFHLVINWDSTWDSLINYGSDWPASPNAPGFYPGSQYASPGYNEYVSANFVSPNQPALASTFLSVPNSTSYTAATCETGRQGGIRQEIYDFPAITNATPGQNIWVWFMPRCSSGSWPASGPPESAWRYGITVPSTPGFYHYYPTTSGFVSNKSMWKDWFQGCGHTVDPAWTSYTTLKRHSCFRPNRPSCICQDGEALANFVVQTVDIGW